MGIVLPFKPRPPLHEINIVHLVTQRDQPYGSQRRCCENCGLMIPGTDRKYVDNEFAYNNLPISQRRCIDKNLDQETHKDW